MVKRFTLAGGTRLIPATSLGDYHRYWLDRDRKVRNDAFDAHSGDILNVKKPDDARHKAAVGRFSREVARAVEQLGLPQPIEIVVVPSSRAGQVGRGLDAIATNVARTLEGVYYRSHSLRRTRDLVKLADGGNRSLNLQRASLEFSPALRAPRALVLFDDVSTTGNSLIASAEAVLQGQRMRVSYAGVTVHAVVLGKTAYE